LQIKTLRYYYHGSKKARGDFLNVFIRKQAMPTAYLLENSSQVWWYTHIIPALGRWRQEDHKFKANLGYIVRPCLKPKKKKKKREREREKE
jgi:hypothetical protein